MTLRHMKIFTTVCYCKSVTEAAKKLGIAQPAASLAIKELENHYNVSLFDRISHKLYITPDGEKLLRYASRIIGLFDEMEGEIKDADSSGILRIGSSITIGTCLMPGFVKRFNAVYPKVKVFVTIDNSAKIEKKILDNQLDFALIEGNIHSDSIVYSKFLKDELVLVCRANGILSGRDEISADELSGLPFILREKGSGTRELFDSALLTKGLTVAPVWESISTKAIINAVLNDLGVSVLPLRLVEHELAARELVSCKISGIQLERYFYLIYHKDKHLYTAAQAFFKLLSSINC